MRTSHEHRQVDKMLVLYSTRVFLWCYDLGFHERMAAKITHSPNGLKYAGTVCACQNTPRRPVYLTLTSHTLNSMLRSALENQCRAAVYWNVLLFISSTYTFMLVGPLLHTSKIKCIDIFVFHYKIIRCLYLLMSIKHTRLLTYGRQQSKWLNRALSLEIPRMHLRISRIQLPHEADLSMPSVTNYCIINDMWTHIICPSMSCRFAS